MPVFVSSTYEDLRDHRAAVEQALHRIEAIVRGMEFFGSRPGRPKDECLAEVRRCRIYIGIFGMRYGSIDPETSNSLTHLEFLEAQRLAKPSLIYIMDEDRHLLLPKFIERGEAAEKLASLKRELMQRFTVGFFTGPDDLARRVSQDLPPILSRAGVEVQPNLLAELAEALPRIDWLSDERWAFIRERLGPLNDRGVAEPALRGAVEFLLSHDHLTASYLIAKSAGLDFRKAIDLGIEIQTVIASIVQEGQAEQLRRAAMAKDGV